MSLSSIELGKNYSLKSRLKNLDLSSDYTIVNIDRCIIKDPDYIDFIEEMIETVPTIIDDLGTFDVMSRIDKKYTEVREKYCDDEFKNDFRESLNKSENIVVESSDIKDFGWIFDLYRDELGKYDIIVGITLSEVCKIISRDIEHSKVEMQEYIDRISTIPPRIVYKSKPEFIRFIKLLVGDKLIRISVIDDIITNNEEIIHDVYPINYWGITDVFDEIKCSIYT